MNPACQADPQTLVFLCTELYTAMEFLRAALDERRDAIGHLTPILPRGLRGTQKQFFGVDEPGRSVNQLR
jgi:hypothetical protein